MIIGNKEQNDTNSKSASGNDSVRKNIRILVNRIISIAGQVFAVGCVVFFALHTKPFMMDYYQKLANRHYDSLNYWFHMGPVFVAALFFSIHSFVNKRYLIGMITIIIAIWSFYWAFLAGPFYCQDCTYGG